MMEVPNPAIRNSNQLPDRDLPATTTKRFSSTVTWQPAQMRAGRDRYPVGSTSLTLPRFGLVLRHIQDLGLP
jgi:hypothetical protein